MMKHGNAILIMIILMMNTISYSQDFKKEQKKYQRVKDAFSEKEDQVGKLIHGKGLSVASVNIFLRAFKEEKILEIWAKDKDNKNYKLLIQYKICSSSGSPGPKRKEGDGQVPEGFYVINCFNPLSNFWLSLGVSYPNASDRILSDKKHPGGAIFIHGNCVTIGCIPITDDKIKELYTMAVVARSNGQKHIPVHIFPCRMDAGSYESLKKKYSANTMLISFWDNLKTGYDLFEKNHSIPAFKVDSNGKYIFTY